MRLGVYLRELSQSKVGLALSVIVALLVAAQVMFSFSLLPPGIDRRSVDIASASTHVLVDTPRSTLTDLRQDVYEVRSLSQRAVILGNVMASPPVRELIGARVGIPGAEIEATGPPTPDQPRAVAGLDHGRQVSEILKRPDEYRLSIQANPTVPVLDVYAEAPDVAAAESLANGADDGLDDYLESVAAERGTPEGERVDLRQLGRARGKVINPGAGPEIAVVVFTAVLALGCGVVLLLGRARRGWASAALAGARGGGPSVAAGDR
jgi:hypothetical protein